MKEEGAQPLTGELTTVSPLLWPGVNYWRDTGDAHDDHQSKPGVLPESAREQLKFSFALVTSTALASMASL